MPILIYVVTSPLTYRASQCPRLQSNSPDCPAVSKNSQTWALPGTKWAMPMSFKSLEEEKSGRRRCKFNPTSQQMLAASWPSLTLITHLVACLAMTVMILRLLYLLMLSKASSRLHPVGSKVLAPTSTKTYFDLHASDALHGLNCSCLILPKKLVFQCFSTFLAVFSLILLVLDSSGMMPALIIATSELSSEEVFSTSLPPLPLQIPGTTVAPDVVRRLKETASTASIHSVQKLPVTPKATCRG